MGWTFTSVLVKKNGNAPQTRASLQRALEAMGCLCYALPENMLLWRTPEDAPPALWPIFDAPALTNPAAIEVVSGGGVGRPCMCRRSAMMRRRWSCLWRR